MTGRQVTGVVKPLLAGMVAGAWVFTAAVPSSAGWEPPGWRMPAASEVREDAGPAALPVRWALDLYRSTVSRVDGDRCPSHPTCTAYARQALSEHGMILGVVLTAGRLIGEADEAAFAPRIHVDGRWKTYAPVEDDLAFLRGRLDP